MLRRRVCADVAQNFFLIFVLQSGFTASTNTNTAQSKQLPDTHPAALKATTKTASKRLVSLESFQTRYTNREDAYKYEWNNGIVEKNRVH